MKDLLIGAADLYDWSKIKVWATSARDSGFTGDIVLLTYRINVNVIEPAEKLGIQVYQIDHDPFGKSIVHNIKGRDTQAHQMRFFHIWQLLSTNNLYQNYRYVIMTDVRDVYFQKNPSDWLTNAKGYINSAMMTSAMVSSSEDVLYENESWGADNMIQGFGPLVWEQAKHWPIYNVGVVAGHAYNIMGLCLTLYNMTHQRYIPSDQSAYNILVNLTMKDMFWNTTHEDDWACQCGTTVDPTKSHLWLHSQIRPTIENNLAVNVEHQPYHIVHQYDRWPEMLTLIENKYGK